MDSGPPLRQNLQLSLALSTACLSIAACSSTPSTEYAYSNPPTCGISNNPSEFIGRTLSLDLIYETDRMEYSYYHDDRCPKYDLIDAGYRQAHPDPSVLRFNKAKDAECAKPANRGLCVLSVRMRVEATVSLGANGEANLDLGKVLFYQF